MRSTASGARRRATTGGLWTLLRTRLLSFGMILGVAFLLMVSLVLGAAIAALGKWWGPVFGDWEVLAQVVNLGIGFPLTTAVFAMIYKLMPRVQVRWHDVWLGALVTALLFTVGKFLIGLYIGKSGIASGYGAAGPLMVVFVGSTTRRRSSCSAPSSPGSMRAPSARCRDSVDNPAIAREGRRRGRRADASDAASATSWREKTAVVATAAKMSGDTRARPRSVLQDVGVGLA